MGTYVRLSSMYLNLIIRKHTHNIYVRDIFRCIIAQTYFSILALYAQRDNNKLWEIARSISRRNTISLFKIAQTILSASPPFTPRPPELIIRATLSPIHFVIARRECQLPRESENLGCGGPLREIRHVCSLSARAATAKGRPPRRNLGCDPLRRII